MLDSIKERKVASGELPRGAIYLDYQASTPTDPGVIEAMAPYFTSSYGNPSSQHYFGLMATKAVESARRSIARGLGLHKAEVLFTSGATESNNLAIKGIARGFAGGHIVTSMIEHKSTLQACKRLEAEGWRVTYLPVDAHGLVNPDELKNALQPDTRLVSIMLGNNEIGSIQPVRTLGAICKENDVLFHCDGTQGFGLLDPADYAPFVDALSFSSHKIYGPKGIGGLVVKRGLMQSERIRPEIEGGYQEGGLRAGTQNVPGIVGLAHAFNLLSSRREAEWNYLQGLRDQLQAALLEHTHCTINGLQSPRLPHNLSLSFPGVNAQRLMNETADIALSSGSACNSASQQPSHVLKAIGLSDELIAGSIRLSLGRFTTESDVAVAVEKLVRAVAKLQKSRS